MFYTHIGSRALGAHRGANAVAPENSIVALQKAYGHCDFVELDMQLSKDGVAVICHDKDLKTLTDIGSVYPKEADRRLSEFSYTELQKLNFGFSFGSKSPILTLRQSLAFAKERALPLNIELKNISESFDDLFVLQRLLEELHCYEMEELVLISSFYVPYLELLHQLMPTLPTALLVEREHPKNLLSFLKALGVRGYHMDEELVSKECIEELHQHGIAVGVYTVNDPKRAQELFSLGVDLLFSDNLEIFV